MIWLLRDFDLLSVVLRGLTLGLEMLTLGGVAFLLFVAQPARAAGQALVACRRGIGWAAAGLAVAEVGCVAVDSAILMGSSSLALGDLLAAPYFLAGMVAAISAGLIVVCARASGSRSTSRATSRSAFWMLPLSVFLMLAVVSTSHAASRMEHRGLLAALTAAHQLGAALWLGGLPFLLLSMRGSEATEEAKRLLRRFSPIALAGAGTLLLGGLGMAWSYLGVGADHSLSGLYGTAYGVTLLAKAYLLLLVVALGAGNYFLVRRIETAPVALLTRLRRFGQVEIGLGFTAVLAAASMTSQPPAVDLPHDRLSVAEIVARFRPMVPRMRSPAYGALVAPAAPLQQAAAQSAFSGATAPSDANDQAWSEYNHHWAGVIVLAAGLLALVSRVPSARWARNWPLSFAALAVFILLRADPDCWPLGPRPFWASFYAPDVLQHRLYAVLILGFAAFEWAVQTGRLNSPKVAAVFPLLLALAGAMLLTHNHSIGNGKDELLAEISHTPIALLGVTAGWSRWLELRLPEHKESRLASYLWPVCLMLAGLVLLNYREA